MNKQLLLRSAEKIISIHDRCILMVDGNSADGFVGPFGSVQELSAHLDFYSLALNLGIIRSQGFRILPSTEENVISPADDRGWIIAESNNEN